MVPEDIQMPKDHMTRQHKEEEKKNTFWVLLPSFPFWMKMVSTHNLVHECFGKFSLWGSTVIRLHSNMHGCVKIPESLLLQEVSTGGENFSIAFRNRIGEGHSCIRTMTMLLVVIVEEAKEDWGRTKNGTTVYSLLETFFRKPDYLEALTLVD